jgi:thiol reductant ABC exporter CydC subunit
MIGALDLSRRSGPIRTRSFAAAVGAGALSTACAIGLMGTSGWLIARASERPPVFGLAVAIGSVQAFALARGVTRYMQRLSVHGVALKRLAGLRLWLYDTVEPLTPNGLPNRGSAFVLNGFVTDVDLTAEALAKAITAATDVAASIVLGVMVAWLLAPGAGAILLSGASGMVCLSLLMGRLGRTEAQRASAVRAELAHSVLESVRSAPELLAYGREDLVAEQLNLIHRRARSAALRQALATGVSRGLTTWVGGAVLIGIVLASLAAHQVGQLSGVMVVVIGLVSLAVIDQCVALPAALSGIAAGDAAASRLADLSQLEPPVREPKVDLSADVNGEGAALAAVDVDPLPGMGGRRLLQNVTLAVAPGQRVALVGRSGSGKSSVLHVLLHFLEAARGTATLGGVDVRSMARSGIAHHVAWLNEEVHVFASTLSENLRLARPSATDAECVDALGRVGLDPWFRSLAEGLGTVLGAGGRPVSAGERQRLGMARALLSGANLLLLDEPTAHLDPESSPRALAELLGAAGSRSVLVVSHESAIPEQVDAVIALDAGRIVSASIKPAVETLNS